MIVGVSGSQNANINLHSHLIIGGIREHSDRGDQITQGGCIGADAIAMIVARLVFDRPIHTVLPADHSKVFAGWRRYTTTWEQMPDGTSYMDRNDRLVEQIDKLIAFPMEATEVLRSGTWSTIRRARRKGIPVIIVPLGGR